MSGPGQFIRRATLDDIKPWVAMANSRYDGRDEKFDAKWIEWCLKNPDRLVLVGRTHAGVAGVNWHYGSERRAHLEVLFNAMGRSIGWEGVAMLRVMLAWAKSRGAKPPFLAGSDTGIDLGPFVKRLGGHKVDAPRYAIPF